MNTDFFAEQRAIAETVENFTHTVQYFPNGFLGWRIKENATKKLQIAFIARKLVGGHFELLFSILIFRLCAGAYFLYLYIRKVEDNQTLSLSIFKNGGKYCETEVNGSSNSRAREPLRRGEETGTARP